MAHSGCFSNSFQADFAPQIPEINALGSGCSAYFVEMSAERVIPRAVQSSPFQFSSVTLGLGSLGPSSITFYIHLSHQLNENQTCSIKNTGNCKRKKTLTGFMLIWQICTVGLRKNNWTELSPEVKRSLCYDFQTFKLFANIKIKPFCPLQKKSIMQNSYRQGKANSEVMMTLSFDYQILTLFFTCQ